MANAYVLWGELRADTSHFERGMQNSESRLRSFEGAMKATRGVVGEMYRDLATLGTVYAGLSIGKAALDRVIEQSRANRLLAASAVEAGISFDSLAAKNAAFAKSAGLSNTAAAETTSNIARLASGAGLTGSMDKLLQSFADLGAARGIAGEDLNNLIGTILSGQDEGLNRLGISDPGKLYEAYAKSVGRSVESLTQQEKVQAAVNAVMEKASIFTGAAADRMNGFDGQIARTTANWNNFLDAMSKTAITSGPVTDFFRELDNLMGGVSIGADEVRKKLREGLSPKQIADQLYTGPSAGDFVSAMSVGGMSGPLAMLAQKSGLLPQFVSDAMNPYKHFERRKKEYEAQIAAEQRSMEKGDASAYQQRVSDSQKQYLAMQKAAMGEQKQKKAEDLIKERNAFLDQSEKAVNAKLAAAYQVREAQLNNHLSATQASEIQSIRATTALKNQQIADQLQNEKAFLRERLLIAKPEERQGLEMQMSAASAKANAEMQANALNAQTQIREAMKRTKEEIASIFVSSQSENPFLAIFDQGRLAVERMTEATRGLNPHLRETLTALQKSSMGAALFKQGLDNKFQAFNLRSQASQLMTGRVPLMSKFIDQQLNAIGAFSRSGLSAAEARALDQKIIDITANVDRKDLTRLGRSAAADARLREAAALDKEKEEAKEIQKQLVEVLKQLNGNKALQIDISDPTNRTTIAGTSANVAAKYQGR